MKHVEDEGYVSSGQDFLVGIPDPWHPSSAFVKAESHQWVKSDRSAKGMQISWLRYESSSGSRSQISNELDSAAPDCRNQFRKATFGRLSCIAPDNRPK